MSVSLWPHGLHHFRLPCPSISQNLLKFMSTESVMLSYHLILCWPLSFHLQSFPPSESFLKQSTLCIGCFLETCIKTLGDLLQTVTFIKVPYQDFLYMILWTHVMVWFSLTKVKQRNINYFDITYLFFSTF